jgi:hypothetical protein
MPKPSGPHGDAGVWSALAVRLSEPDRLVCAMAVREILGREAEVQAVGRFLDGPAPAGLVLEGPPASARPRSGALGSSTHAARDTASS